MENTPSNISIAVFIENVYTTKTNSTGKEISACFLNSREHCQGIIP
jgi:hypothetical protein